MSPCRERVAQLSLSRGVVTDRDVLEEGSASEVSTTSSLYLVSGVLKFLLR